ncbi:hypothetical protein QTP88_021070 [Uroleucon formosanum]
MTAIIIIYQKKSRKTTQSSADRFWVSFDERLSCIPATSSYRERVFSMMNLKYRDERNKCRLELIKYELIITLNAKETCTEICDTFLKDEKLLKAAKSNKNGCGGREAPTGRRESLEVNKSGEGGEPISICPRSVYKKSVGGGRDWKVVGGERGYLSG